MKKTTTQAQAKVNTTKARTAKSTKPTTTTKTKTNIDVTTIQLGSDISVTIETETLARMESWAYHTHRDLAEDSLHVGMALADGKTDNLIGFTEAELNQMIADAGLILSLADPSDNDRYCVTGCNVFESCTYIIAICRAYINALHGNYAGVRLEPAKPKRKPGKISVVKTMSEGLKYTDADDWDDF